jgi:hypothetical protein
MKSNSNQEIINDLRDIQLTLSRLAPEIKSRSKKSYTTSSIDRVVEMIHIIRLDLEDV